MELNKIRVILDDSGSIETLVTPVINQYATNYLIEVAFRNEYEDNRIYKVVFNINGKESPAKVLAPTDRYYDFEDGTKSAHFWEYKLTQYETQFYQDALEFSLIVENEADVITTQKISLTMSKQRFNKLTPVNLENNTSLDSVVLSISDLDKVIDSRNEAAKQETLEEASKLDSALEIKLNARIIESSDELHDRIDGVEDYYNSEISRVDADINAGDTRLDEKIDNAVNEMTAYTDRQLTSYDEYAHDIFITGDDIQQDLYPYIDRKTAEAKDYADEKIADLVGSAPETLNTLKEIADALKDQDDVITAIETTIGEKADRSELDDKVTKLHHSNQIYATDSSGAEFSLTYGEGYEVGSIPIRDSNGNITVGETPYGDNDATSKKYVDEQVNTKIGKLNPPSYSGIDQVFVQKYSDKSIYGVTLGKPGFETSGAIAMYSGAGSGAAIPSGKLIVGTPVNKGHAANKDYVDTLFNGAVVEIPDTAVSLEMKSNTEYRCTAATGITSLNITSFTAAPSGVAEEWNITFKTGSTVTVNLPSNIKWAVANPVFSAKKTYMITFIRFGDYYLGVWTVEA